MIKVLALVFDEHKILRPLDCIESINIEYKKITADFLLSKPYPDIIITVSDWRADVARILIDAKKRNIPTLIFQDGTLDWIIHNEGDKYGGGGGPTHFHPILADKIAVIGRQSARTISAWNNPNKIEITGFPKLQDQINNFNSEKYFQVCKNPVSVLIVSTRQGWFSEKHKKYFINALNDLKKYFTENPNYNVTWRLSRNLSETINVTNNLKEKESYELVNSIKKADLVISAQSTAVVEAMLCNKPVAIIDYLNSPQYYNTAWKITSSNQIENVISSMLIAEKSRFLFQLEQLYDVLEMKSNSISNSEKLIKEMVDHNKKYNNLNFKTNILNYNRPFSEIKNSLKIEEIYPMIKQDYSLSKSELTLLITRYRHENEILRKKLKDKSFLEYLVKLKNKIFN